MTGDEMQTYAIAQINEHGSAALRVKVAEFLAQATTSQDVRQVVLPLLF